MKKRPRRGLTALVILLALAGCARDRVQIRSVPGEVVERNSAKRICIVENPRVAVTGFLPAYRAALQSRGYAASVVDKTPSAAECPLTTRYMAFQNGLAQLEVFWDGQPVGSAAHSNAAHSEEAIKNMVQGLFP